MIIPSCIRSGRSDVTRSPRLGGVISLRFRGSEKKDQASSTEIGRVWDRFSLYSFML